MSLALSAKVFKPYLDQRLALSDAHGCALTWASALTRLFTGLRVKGGGPVVALVYSPTGTDFNGFRCH